MLSVEYLPLEQEAGNSSLKEDIPPPPHPSAQLSQHGRRLHAGRSGELLSQEVRQCKIEVEAVMVVVVRRRA